MQRFKDLTNNIEIPEGFALDESTLDLNKSSWPAVYNVTDDNRPTFRILFYDYVGWSESQRISDELLIEMWGEYYPNDGIIHIPKYCVQYAETFEKLEGGIDGHDIDWLHDDLTDDWNEVLNAIEQWKKTQNETTLLQDLEDLVSEFSRGKLTESQVIEILESIVKHEKRNK
mgnify:FL=1